MVTSEEWRGGRRRVQRGLGKGGGGGGGWKGLGKGLCRKGRGVSEGSGDG